MGAGITGPPLRAVLIVIAVGALLGLGVALRFSVVTPVGEEPLAPEDTRPAFASYVLHFFPGRTPDGSRPGRKSPLLRATKFLAGERVGLRVQTAPERREGFIADVRFLTRTTQEELPGLWDDRQRFRIRPGLRTYCCLRIPHEPGEYNLALLVEGQFIAFLPLTVDKAPPRGEGGLLVNP